MNRLVICDLDGTLIDSRADLATAVNLVRAEHGLPALSVDVVTSYVGDGVRKLVERSLAEVEADIDEAISQMRSFYLRNMLDETTVYPTVFEGLTTLRNAGFKLAIATNKPQSPCDGIVSGLGLSPYFDVVLGGRDEYPLKPDPAMLRKAMEMTGASPATTWVIGDNHTDLASGRRANAKRCFADYGFGLVGGEAYDMRVDSFASFADDVV